VQVVDYITLDGVRYQPEDIIAVDNREEMAELLTRVPKISGIILPWYDRIVPPGLLRPHENQVDLKTYRARLTGTFFNGFLVTTAGVAGAYVFPEYMAIALILATLYGLFPLVDAVMEWTRRVDRIPVSELNARVVNLELFQRWLPTRKSGPLKIGIAILVLLFLGQFWVGIGPSVEAAALVKRSVVENGEWWRMITGGLLHGDPIHILFNGMAFYSLGRVIVSLVSPSLLSIVFLFTVITGSLASLGWMDIEGKSVGASGGILGCLGFLLVLTWKFKADLPRYLQAACIRATIVMAIFGLLGHRFIDNAGHAGGFLGGLMLGLVFYPYLKLADGTTTLPIRMLSILSLSILISGVAKVVYELWGLAQASSLI